jgi:hypothetical protein
MNEERKTPQSTAELAYGRDEKDAPTRPPMSPDDQAKGSRPMDGTGPESGRTTTQDAMTGRPATAADSPGSDGRPAPVSDTSMEQAPLLDHNKAGGYSNRWQEVQAKFVEEPKDAVREADGLVAEVIQELATSFAGQRQKLEGKWDSGTDVSTEDLRQALIQYRSFFQRLLAA